MVTQNQRQTVGLCFLTQARKWRIDPMRLIVAAILSALLVAPMALAKHCTGANCQCGDTLVADLVLPGDVYCPNVPTAINIGSGVTLDCGGHAISGNFYGPDSVGIRTVGTNAVIRHCSITGFFYGYRIQG